MKKLISVAWLSYQRDWLKAHGFASPVFTGFALIEEYFLLMIIGTSFQVCLKNPVFLIYKIVSIQVARASILSVHSSCGGTGSGEKLAFEVLHFHCKTGSKQVSKPVL
jgi:hypothetical protein